MANIWAEHDRTCLGDKLKFHIRNDSFLELKKIYLGIFEFFLIKNRTICLKQTYKLNKFICQFFITA